MDASLGLSEIMHQRACRYLPSSVDHSFGLYHHYYFPLPGGLLCFGLKFCGGGWELKQTLR